MVNFTAELVPSTGRDAIGIKVSTADGTTTENFSIIKQTDKDQITTNKNNIASLQTTVANKQDKLTNTTKVGTINGKQLNWQGDITIETPGIAIDSALSTTSTNPVQNKVITGHINTIEDFVFEQEIYLRMGLHQASTGNIIGLDGSILNSVVGQDDRIIIEATSGDKNIDWSKYNGTIMFLGEQDGVSVEDKGINTKCSTINTIHFNKVEQGDNYSIAYSYLHGQPTSIYGPKFTWAKGDYLIFSTIQGDNSSTAIKYHRPKQIFKPIRKS